jgi:hypothetical protein
MCTGPNVVPWGPAVLPRWHHLHLQPVRDCECCPGGPWLPHQGRVWWAAAARSSLVTTAAAADLMYELFRAATTSAAAALCAAAAATASYCVIILPAPTGSRCTLHGVSHLHSVRAYVTFWAGGEGTVYAARGATAAAGWGWPEADAACSQVWRLLVLDEVQEWVCVTIFAAPCCVVVSL